jgi:hypothetical protein
LEFACLIDYPPPINVITPYYLEGVQHNKGCQSKLRKNETQSLEKSLLFFGKMRNICPKKFVEKIERKGGGGGEAQAEPNA